MDVNQWGRGQRPLLSLLRSAYLGPFAHLEKFIPPARFGPTPVPYPDAVRGEGNVEAKLAG